MRLGSEAGPVVVVLLRLGVGSVDGGLNPDFDVDISVTDKKIENQILLSVC